MEERILPTATLLLLDADTLPLVLLAAVGHPDVLFRDRLRLRLDESIEEARPLHSVAEVCQFLTDQPGSPRDHFYLEPQALEIAICVVRWLLSHRTRKLSRQSVRIVSCDALDVEGGVVVNPQLKSLYLDRFFPAWNSRPRQRRRAQTKPDPDEYPLRKAARSYRKTAGHGCVFVAGAVAERLREFAGREPGIVARCHVGTGFRLTLYGGLPWSHADLEGSVSPNRSRVRLAEGSSLGAHRGLASLGLAFASRPGELDLWTTSPEGVIRFSASLVRGERLVLQDAGSSTARIVVQLCDFDDEFAWFPAVVTHSGAETWLRGLPALPLSLDDDERLAIARWAYAPLAWLTNELLEKLL